MSLKFAFNLYRIQLRMIFGGKHRYRKEYDAALDSLEERGHWLYLYDSLDGPNGKRVCAALNEWIQAHEEKKEYKRAIHEMYTEHILMPREDQEKWSQILLTEQRLKKELHLMIYGKFTEGEHGYESDDE